MPATAPTFSAVAGPGTGSIIPGAPTTPTPTQTPALTSSASPNTQSANTTTEPTVLSSANVDTKNQNNQNTLATAAAANPTTNGGTGIQNARESGGTFQGDDGQLYYNYDSTPVAGQGSMIPGTTYTSTGDPGVDNTLSQIYKFQQQTDATSAAMLDSIRSQYQDLIAQQTQSNTASQAAEQTSLIRSGSARYTQDESTGTMQTLVSNGLQKIGNLITQENSALLSAQQAQQSKDWQTLDKVMTVYDQIRQEKQAETTKLNEALMAKTQQANTDAAVTKVLESGVSDPSQILASLRSQGDTTTTLKDITDTISNLNPNASAVNTIMQDAAKNGAPQQVLASIGKATSVSSAIQASGTWLQTATGTMGDYLQYQRQAQAGGQTPMSYQSFLNAQDYAKAYATAKGTEAGKLAAAGNAAGAGGSSFSNIKTKNDIPAQYRGYASQSASGVWYLDLSSADPKTKTAVMDATQGNIPVITDKNNANDLRNINDAVKKLGTIADAMKDLNSSSSLSRDLGGAGLTELSKAAQTNPKAAAAQALNDSALDILKSISGVQGFRGNQAAIQQVKDALPKITDTQDTSAQKLQTVAQLIQDRESAILGTSGPTDYTSFVIRSEDQAKQAIVDFGNKNPDQQTNITKIISSNNPQTGEPYSYLEAAQILGVNIPGTNNDPFNPFPAH